jgi:putative Mg2+ transporter-C (MgtC) family protein
MDLEASDVGLRLAAAAVIGGLVGLNRDLADKPIGTRTLALVALGAAIVSIATIEVPTIYEHPDALSRVIQGIVQGVMAGISFIGAGVILRHREARTVEGLTTAASVWVTAALGIACGLAAWDVVLIGAAITLLVLASSRVFEWLSPRKDK